MKIIVKYKNKCRVFSDEHRISHIIDWAKSYADEIDGVDVSDIEIFNYEESLTPDNDLPIKGCEHKVVKDVDVERKKPDPSVEVPDGTTHYCNEFNTIHFYKINQEEELFYYSFDDSAWKSSNEFYREVWFDYDGKQILESDVTAIAIYLDVIDLEQSSNEINLKAIKSFLGKR